TQGLARSLDVSERRAASLIDDGPYAAVQALKTPLVDGAADGMRLEGALRDVIDGPVRLRDELHPFGPRSWSTGRHVAVVVIYGMMVGGEIVDIPILGVQQPGARTIVETIERLANDRSVGASVVRIDSPGGSALASDQIWRAIMRARRTKPVIASLGTVAA